MAKPLVTDDLWAVIEPLFPKPRRYPKGGRPRVDNRAVLTGILFVLKTGIPWEYLPLELGCGSGMTCWRRLRDWQKAGVWNRLHRVLLNRLRAADRIDFSRAVVDSGSVRAGRRGKKTGPNPTDRRKAGSKHHVITDANGVPLAVRLTGANRHDVTQLLPLVDAIPPIAGKPGAPRRRPDQLYADRAYDSHLHRMLLWLRGIEPVLARRRTAHGSGLGRFRWVVERTISWLHRFRRLRARYERNDRIHEAFLSIGCGLICWNVLKRGFC
ncbi:MAG: IS5 family transposase [Phycisphaerales bacterium]|nr:IS5 family transposase [Phycisphaerales bacterium]